MRDDLKNHCKMNADSLRQREMSTIYIQIYADVIILFLT